MIKHVPKENPMHKLSSSFIAKIKRAQNDDFASAFPDAKRFIEAVLDQLRISATVPSNLAGVNASKFSDRSYADFVRYFSEFLSKQNYPSQATGRTAASLATRAMLLRAFSAPDDTVAYVKNKILTVIGTFPKTASDIEVGRNKGDVLDPFILAATQYLLYRGEFDGAVSATVSHKALMIIEGLMGHLHEDVLGLMRGNVRVPEPRGKDQEAFNYKTNPFPGADLIQPPVSADQKLRVHQIKSKTGSAKGGDGKRLGDQLKFLSEHYDAEIFYDALVGNTLVGHRSKTGVEKAAPAVRVLVGQAAFKHLTGSEHGAGLLLRLYQEAFLSAAESAGYSINEVTEGIVEYFKVRSEAAGETFLDTILFASTGGRVEEQDSYYFNKLR